MSRRRKARRIAGRFIPSLAVSLAVAAAAMPRSAMAAEGGVTFWIPGFFGSLAATPLEPGFSYTNIYYNWNGQAGADLAFARQVHRGGLTVPFSGNLTANLHANASLNVAIPGYTFAEKIFGAQATVMLLVPYGRATASVDAALNATVGPVGPFGPFGFTVGRSLDQGVTGFADLVPVATLRWNSGVHNVMTYFAGNIPVGRYDPNRIVNLGLGYQALDGGIGYTYFDKAKGHEFSGVLGFTYNWENKYTNYQNGTMMHFDWGVSQFLSPQVQVGFVGYVLNQIGCDSGSGDRVGCFQTKVAGIGPQFGYIMPLGHLQAYFNLKGYAEFAEAHRPAGFNAWFTISLSPAAPTPTSARRPMTMK